jgi:hypothetical protein
VALSHSIRDSGNLWGEESTTVRFINYSDRPLIEVPSFCQDGSDHRGSKPNGIWLSVIGEDGSDSWKVYCDAKGIALKKHRTEIVIKENARILHLQNAAEVDSLTSTHGYFPECPAEFLKSDPNYVRSAICWRRVAEEYDGIVIAPECVERRQERLWYYTWDCSSGCIWSPNAVEALKTL